MYCKIPDIFRQWRNMVGSILFVLQNSWHFGPWYNLLYLYCKIQTVEEYGRIYFICTHIFKVSWLFWGLFSNSLAFFRKNSFGMYGCQFWVIYIDSDLRNNDKTTKQILRSAQRLSRLKTTSWKLTACCGSWHWGCCRSCCRCCCWSSWRQCVWWSSRSWSTWSPCGFDNANFDFVLKKINIK